MSDGTIEEDFEQALAREMADRRGSGDHVNAENTMTLEGRVVILLKARQRCTQNGKISQPPPTAWVGRKQIENKQSPPFTVQCSMYYGKLIIRLL